MRTLSHRRLVVTAALVALIPIALEVPALLTLAAVAALCVGLIVYEAVRYADARERVRNPVEAST